MDKNTRYMTTREVAAYVGLSHRTLESYRCRGGGPPYYDLEGVVRYLLSDVIEWASKRRRNSTSDDGQQGPIPKDGDEEDEENDGEDDDDGTDGPGRSR
jgi:predicted DNA-binding transcriptional regulator AlpA